MSSSLAGLTVVNTRPAHQAKPLSDLITASGGSVIDFPVIEIKPPSNPDRLQSQLVNLAEANLAIFISANAVENGIGALGGPEYWPKQVAIAAVGRATASKLSSLGLETALVAPEPYNTEALLTLPELVDMNGKSVKIFRGEGGRELLAQTLRERGATVDYVECYRRVIPESSPADLYQCWGEKHVLLIVVTSNEGLQNLYKMIDKDHRSDLLSTTLVAVSQRTKDKATELGFETKPEISSNASNEAILEAIQYWYLKRSS